MLRLIKAMGWFLTIVSNGRFTPFLHSPTPVLVEPAYNYPPPVTYEQAQIDRYEGIQQDLKEGREESEAAMSWRNCQMANFFLSVFDRGFADVKANIVGANINVFGNAAPGIYAFMGHMNDVKVFVERSDDCYKAYEKRKKTGLGAESL